MAEGDPKLGQTDAWNGDVLTLSTHEDSIPTLYHYKESFYSQIVRLVLAETGVEYKSRLINIAYNVIDGGFEQLQPWFLSVSPKGLVPTLLYKGKPMVESKDIALFIIKELANGNLLLPEGEKRNEVLDLVELFFKDLVGASQQSPIEELTYGVLMSEYPIIKMVNTKILNNAISKLEAMKKEHPELESILDNKLEQKKGQQKIIEDPLPRKEYGLKQVQGVLDVFEKKLQGSEGEFLCGSQYSLADALCTVLLGRVSTVNMLDEELKQRPGLSKLWTCVKKRESFSKACIFYEAPGFSTIAKKVCNIL